jgi:hypothetical protein
MEASVEFRSHFFPRDRLYLTGIDLTNAPFDLLGPSRFDIFVGLSM